MINAANLFTLLRLLLAPVVATDIIRGRWTRALIVLFVAGFTDVIDGFLARHAGKPTRVGAYFDPIADKILLIAIYVALGAAQAIPLWMVLLVFGRDLLILAMAGYGLAFTTIRQFPPSVWGKISTAVQIAFVLAVLLDIRSAAQVLLWAVAALTLWSGVDYARRAIL